MDKIFADTMKFDADLVVGRLCAFFFEIKDQCAASELKRVTLLNRFSRPCASCAAVTSKMP